MFQVFNWAEHQANRHKCEPSNIEVGFNDLIKHELDGILPKINFGIMSLNFLHRFVGMFLILNIQLLQLFIF